MVAEDQLGAVADEHVRGVDAALVELVEFALQRDRVGDDAVADYALDAGAEDPRRHQMQHVTLVADLDGVPGIVAALKAHHHVDVAGQHVDKFSLALVAPLGPDQNVHRHDPILLKNIRIFLSLRENGTAAAVRMHIKYPVDGGFSTARLELCAVKSYMTVMIWIVFFWVG